MLTQHHHNRIIHAALNERRKSFNSAAKWVSVGLVDIQWTVT